MPRVNRIDPKIDPKIYTAIINRYNLFIENSDDETKPIIRVFDPLSQKHLDAIEICRDVTKTLMMKKEEDMLKAAAAAEEAIREKEEAKKLAAENKAKEVESSDVSAEDKEVTEVEEEKKQQ